SGCSPTVTPACRPGRRPPGTASALPGSALQVGVEPALDGAGAHAQLVGDALARQSAVGQAPGVEPVAELSVGGGAEGLLQPLGLGFAQVNANHRGGSASVP